MAREHKFELVGKVNQTEVWRGKHYGPHKTLTFYVVVQCRYHTWYAWLVASNKGWDDGGYISKDRKTEDQEVVDLLDQVINDHSKDPHPPSFEVYAGGKDAKDALERLVSVIIRAAEAMAPPEPEPEPKKKKPKKKKVTANEDA